VRVKTAAQSEVRCRSHAEIMRFVYASGGAPVLGVEIEDPVTERVYRNAEDFLESSLKQTILQALRADFSEAKWAGLKEEMADSLLNEARSLEAQKKAYETVQSLLARSGDKSLFGSLTRHGDAAQGLRDLGHDAASVLVQIGSFSGHRTHPCTKARLLLEEGAGPLRRPLSAAEFDTYAPEAGGDVCLPVLAVRKDRVTETTSRKLGYDYTAFFVESFPDSYRAWAESVAQSSQGARPSEFVPIPVHPLQLDAIRARLAGPITAGDILLETDGAVIQRPTISFRTFTPVGRPHEPQIKTTLAMLMTSEVRIMSPARTFNAPVLSDLLLDVTAGDDQLAGKFRPLPDPASACWGRNPDPASGDYKDGFHLGVVLRRNPVSLLATGEIGVPLNTLLSRSPVSGAPLLTEIMAEARVAGGAEALAWFRHYAETVLSVIIGLLARYGVGLEAHQQNTDLIFDTSGRLTALAYRDASGGMEIYEAMLIGAGFDIRPALHPFIRSLCDSIDLPIQQTMHTTFVSHLFPVAGLIADTFGSGTTALLGVMKETIVAVLGDAHRRFRRDSPPLLRDALAVIEHRILHAPVETKMLLRMRAAQSHDVTFTAIENPLARV
jgi:D-ornithine---citrate ligase